MPRKPAAACGKTTKAKTPPPLTPDGRYIVVRGRLWRASNPGLTPEARQGYVNDLQDARRAVKAAKKEPNADAAAAAMKQARQNVQAAKEALGERGPVWWTDGTPDCNRRMAKNTQYADWWAEQEEAPGGND